MWTVIGKTTDFEVDSAKEVVVGCEVIAVFRTESGFFAVDAMCAHQGGPLANGKIQGCTVTCPWHGWQYNLETGQQLTAKSVRVKSFPVKIENDEILVSTADS